MSEYRPDEEWNWGYCEFKGCDALDWVILTRTKKLVCLSCFEGSSELPARSYIHEQYGVGRVLAEGKRGHNNHAYTPVRWRN